MKLLFTALLTLMGFPVIALAQAEGVPPETITVPFSELSTISGVVAATLIVVEVIKRSTVKVPYIQSLPVWVIAVAVSIALTVLANQVFDTLEGDTWALAWSAALSAAAASGFHTWLRKPLEGPSRSSLISKG